MLKKRAEQISYLIRVLDVLTAVGAFALAYALRTLPGFPSRYVLPHWENLTWLLGASIVLHFLIYSKMGFYLSIRLQSYFGLLKRMFQAMVIEFFVLGSLVFIIQAKETSRVFFILYIVSNFVLLFVIRGTARFLLSSIRKRGYNYRKVWIVGADDSAVRMITTLRGNPHWGYVPSGLLLFQGERPPEKNALLDVPVLGFTRDLERLSKEVTLDEVYLTPASLGSKEAASILSLCEKTGIPCHFLLDGLAGPGMHYSLSQIGGLPILTAYTSLMSPVEAFIKRCLDILISLFGLLITALLYPWISLMIRMQSPGPVIFKQQRIGENGRRFKCYKFRTMVVNAEKLKTQLLEKNQMQGPLFKVENDPRIFSFGAFLRRTSLDELPQFLNVLRGDMSIVGTRPPTPDEVEQYETRYRRRLSIRPGLTGLWQVSGRNQITKFEDVLELDLKYIDEWSLFLDIKIIFKTIGVVLFGRGAH